MTVPTMLHLMLEVPGIDKIDYSSLKYLICGGAPVTMSLINAYKDMGIVISQVYGATEYTGATTFWTSDMPFEKTGTVGKAVFHGDVKVFEPGSDRELPAGEVGELCLFGPQIFSGYWENEEATREVVVDEYYRSGDLGKKDAEGFVTVVDRLKDMIISGGENIYPAELEAVIQTHPDVLEVAVVGKKDQKWDEIPVAFVALKKDAQVGEAAIKELCKENLAGYKCVKEVRFVDAVPRNSLGKVLRRELRDQVH